MVCFSVEWRAWLSHSRAHPPTPEVRPQSLSSCPYEFPKRKHSWSLQPLPVPSSHWYKRELLYHCTWFLSGASQTWPHNCCFVGSKPLMLRLLLSLQPSLSFAARSYGWLLTSSLSAVCRCRTGEQINRVVPPRSEAKSKE